jgi:ribose 1,5-bisphosphokinase
LSGRGTLFLIVGPSGAGKDSLIAAARKRLEGGGRFVFPKRVITRRERDPSEDHIFEDAADFEAHERAGAFALCWRAHGLAYGIPAAIEQDLARGLHAVANVSRAAVEEARRRFAPTRVIAVTAPREVLAARLKARGREGGAAISERVDRAVAVAADTVVVNDGPLERAVEAFLRALSEVESSPKAP